MTERAPREPGLHTRKVSKQETYGWEPCSPLTPDATVVELGLYEAFIFDEYITATERYEKLLRRLTAERRLKE